MSSKVIYTNDDIVSEDEEDDTVELTNEDYEILQEQEEYESIVCLLDIIKDYRYYKNPLVLDLMTQFDFIKFIENL